MKRVLDILEFEIELKLARLSVLRDKKSNQAFATSIEDFDKTVRRLRDTIEELKEAIKILSEYENS
jgi:hypothetical protein